MLIESRVFFFFLPFRAVADEAGGQVGKKQGIFRKIEQNNCFIIQHIDNKAQFYCRKVRDDLYFAIFPFFGEFTVQQCCLRPATRQRKVSKFHVIFRAITQDDKSRHAADVYTVLSLDQVLQMFIIFSSI